MRESVILIPVPTADPIVGKWREKYDTVVLHGIPAHITLLFPFIDPIEINNEILEKLRGIFAKAQKFHFSLERVNTFPGVIFLEPTDKDKFISLTENIVKKFPEYPPYGGKYPTINPHLTIGQLTSEQNMEDIKRDILKDIEKKMPFAAEAREVWLMEKYDVEWTIREKFSLF